ncbi:MAG TPA: hypothetical protein VJN95_10995 [Gemmatimonadales bacterium]|nr:hypothetical protein [Gemmatimonadales bacterium]
MRPQTLRLKALFLALLLLGGSLGLPVLDLMVWHSGTAHGPVAVHTGGVPRSADQHDRQCQFNNLIPSATPTPPAPQSLALCPVLDQGPIAAAGLLQSPVLVGRANSPRAPPAVLA